MSSRPFLARASLFARSSPCQPFMNHATQLSTRAMSSTTTSIVDRVGELVPRYRAEFKELKSTYADKQLGMIYIRIHGQVTHYNYIHSHNCFCCDIDDR